MARIEAVYRLRSPEEDAGAMARAIAYEQTVELPENLVDDPHVVENVLGRVDGVDPDPSDAGAFLARLSYPEDASNYQLPQLLNLLYGNVSLHPQVRLVDMRLPESFLARFEGPGFGVAGLRRVTGVTDRPLVASVLKPRGAPVERLAALAGDFARGGGDIIKDDQNLFDETLEGFRRRITACARAVDDGNATSGHSCLYFPHLAGPDPSLRWQLDLVSELGLRGVLMSPMVLGLDRVRSLAGTYDLVVMAHPALAGAYVCNRDGGIDHGILLGTLFRLAGADISIFPNTSGRFAFTPRACKAIRDRSLEPLGELKPMLPCPAGGMGFDDLPRLCRDYGSDAVFLIGGSLLGHSDDLAVSTRRFVDRVGELSR